MTNSLCLNRLSEERKLWRKDHPFGFFARPQKKSDGTLNLMQWTCGIPGKPNTIWEGGVYKADITFFEEYPQRAPKVRFNPPIFHPNVWTSGLVCLSILDDDKGWKPNITLRQILLGVQQMLTEPNPLSPANGEADRLYAKDRQGYDKKIQNQAKQFSMDAS